MDTRRGFLARLGAALLVAIGLPLPASARVASPAPRRHWFDPVVDESWDGLDAAIDALPVEPAMWPLPDTAPYEPYVDGTRRQRKPYTLRSWRAMTHPLTATAEEKRLAKLSWEKPGQPDDADDDTCDWLEWPPLS